MPGALVIQTRSSLWYLQSRLKLQGKITGDEGVMGESEKVKSFSEKQKLSLN